MKPIELYIVNVKHNAAGVCVSGNYNMSYLYLLTLCSTFNLKMSFTDRCTVVDVRW